MADPMVTPMQMTTDQKNDVNGPKKDVHQATQDELDNPTTAATGAIVTDVGDVPQEGSMTPPAQLPSILAQARALFNMQHQRHQGA